MRALFLLHNSNSMKRVDSGNTEIECEMSLRYQTMQSTCSHSDRRGTANDALHSGRFMRDSPLANHDQQTFSARSLTLSAPYAPAATDWRAAAQAARRHPRRTPVARDRGVWTLCGVSVVFN